jgi:hypothetical protein
MEFRIRSNGSVVDYESLRAAFPNNFIAASPTAAYLGDLGVDLVVETFAPVITDLQLALRQVLKRMRTASGYTRGRLYHASLTRPTS